MSRRAPRNRTLALEPEEEALYAARLHRLGGPAKVRELLDKTICQDLLDVLDLLPRRFVDLLIIDPPYNLNKKFKSSSFHRASLETYADWFDSWFVRLKPILKPTASVYMCADWHSSTAVHQISERHLIVRNRITWEREKGRGAKTNWKNCSEDIWFCTATDDYVFNVEQVKLKRRVMAPYTDNDGAPKDWTDSSTGKFRLTHPSNIWTDMTVPFWSMPENTEHPTQKPEKLIARIILASSNIGDIVFDPFLGSGTTSVVAKKLDRRYVGVEIDPHYCCLAEKRLALAEHDTSIQGYHEGVFWERNTLNRQKRSGAKRKKKGEARAKAFPFFENDNAE